MVRSFPKKKSLELAALRIAPKFTWSLRDKHGISPYRLFSRSGRYSGSRISLLATPSRFPSGCFVAFVPDYSGGTAPDSHGIPY